MPLFWLTSLYRKPIPSLLVSFSFPSPSLFFFAPLFFRSSLYTFLSFLSLLGERSFLPRRSIFCVPKWEFFQLEATLPPAFPYFCFRLHLSSSFLSLLPLAIPTAHPVSRSVPLQRPSLSRFFFSLLLFVTFIPLHFASFVTTIIESFSPSFLVLISSPSFPTPSFSSLRDCTSIFFLRLHQVLSSRSSRYFPIFMLDTFRAFSLSPSFSVLLPSKRNRPSLKHTFPPRIPFHFHSEQPTSTSPAESQGNPTRISSLGTFSLTPLRYFLFLSLSKPFVSHVLYFFHPSYDVRREWKNGVIDFSFFSCSYSKKRWYKKREEFRQADNKDTK